MNPSANADHCVLAFDVQYNFKILKSLVKDLGFRLRKFKDAQMQIGKFLHMFVFI